MRSLFKAVSSLFVLAAILAGGALFSSPQRTQAQSMELVQYYVSTEFIGCETDCCWTGYCCAAILLDCTPVIH
jgi:hypothetical protein